MSIKETMNEEIIQEAETVEAETIEVVNSEEVETATEEVELEDLNEINDSNDISEEESSNKEEKSSKSFFKKDKKEKKDKKDIQIEELNDRLMRNMAEFDNFRKRSEKEKAQMFEMGAKDIIEKILPVVDSFDRGFDTVTEEEKDGAFVQGIEKIYKQLLSTLEAAGIKPIEAVGKEFDLNLHNAVMHSEDENFGENMVAEELQKGYTYRDSVIRYSMVKVVN